MEVVVAEHSVVVVECLAVAEFHAHFDELLEGAVEHLVGDSHFAHDVELVENLAERPVAAHDVELVVNLAEGAAERPVDGHVAAHDVAMQSHLDCYVDSEPDFCLDSIRWVEVLLVFAQHVRLMLSDSSDDASSLNFCECFVAFGLLVLCAD